MNNYKETFINYASEALLEKRALGAELSDDAHTAIEEIFAERGEKLPPRPSKPIFFDPPKTKGNQALKHIGVVALFFGAAILAKVIINSWLVFPVAIVCSVFMSLNGFRATLEQPKFKRSKKA